MMIALRRLRELIDRSPLRGIKGPMGTGQDMLALLGGERAALADLERPLADLFGLCNCFQQRGAGGSPFIGPRRGFGSGAARRGAVITGTHDSIDGRPRARHRGFRAGSGRFVGDAAQDEHPQLRTGQRAAGCATRLCIHGGRVSRCTVERG